MGWPHDLEYPAATIEMVATFIVTDDGHIPDEIRLWAATALADVSDAANQLELVNESRWLHPSNTLRRCPNDSCRKVRDHDGPHVGSFSLDDLERDQRGEGTGW